MRDPSKHNDEPCGREDQRAVGPSDDAIWELVLRLAARDVPDPDDPKNAPYWEWRARRARERLTPVEQAVLAERATLFARRQVARHHAAQAKVRLMDGAAPLRALEDAVPVEAWLRGRDSAQAIPALDGRAAAGAGRALLEEPCTHVLDRPAELRAGRYLSLLVAGESMAPLLHDGDRILVELGARAEAGMVAVVRTADDDYVVKLVARATRDFLELESLNAEFAPIVVRRDGSETLGRVVMRWCEHGG